MKNVLTKNRPYIDTIINKLLYCVCSFLANAFLTRALGVTLKGEYAWMLNCASIVSIIAGLGVYQSIPYFIREKKEKEWIQEYINIFVFQMMVYIFITIVILALKRDLVIAVICFLSIVDIFSQQLNMLLLIDKIYLRNKIFVSGAMINLIISAVCFFLLRDNLWVGICCTFCVKIFYIISYLIVIGRIPHPFSLSLKSIVEKIQFGYLPMLSFLLITMNYKVDVLMLKAAPSVNAEALSLYTVGVSIAEIAWVIPDGFKEVLFSRTSNKKNDSEIAAALRVSNCIISITILGILVFGKPIIYILFGAEFIESYKVTLLLFLGIPAMSWFKIIYTLFNAQGKRKTSFAVLLSSTLLNIGLNYLLIPMWGIYGAAGTSVFSYGICGGVFLILYSRDSGISFLSLFVMKKDDLRKLLRRDKNVG